MQILPGDEKACRVTVPDNQLSLAIGNKGQNAKLAAKLTGYKIDIRSENEALEEEKEATDENEELFSEDAPAAEDASALLLDEEEPSAEAANETEDMDI